jgi:hypothetical protein
MPTRHEQIQTLLNEEKTQEALDLFSETGSLEAKMLQARYDHLMQVKPQNSADSEHWHIERNRIHFALLEFTKEEPLTGLSEGQIKSEKTPKRHETTQQPTVLIIEESQKLNPSAAAPLIRQALREGNLEEAVQLLFRADMAIANVLHGRLSESARLSVLGLIGIEERARLQVQICEAILNDTEMRATASTQTPSTDTKTQILQLLQEQKTEKALNLCQEFGDEFLLLQASFSLAQKEWRKNLIESEYFEALKSKINYSLQELLGEIPEHGSEPTSGWMDKIRGLFK